MRSLRPGRSQRADDGADLAQRIPHVDAERLVDRAVPDPDAEEQPPARELLHRRCLLGEERRLAQVDVGDRGPDLHPGGAECDRLGVREGVAERLRDEDGLVAERLGAPRPREDVLRGGVA